MGKAKKRKTAGIEESTHKDLDQKLISGDKNVKTKKKIEKDQEKDTSKSKEIAFRRWVVICSVVIAFVAILPGVYLQYSWNSNIQDAHYRVYKEKDTVVMNEDGENDDAVNLMTPTAYKDHSESAEDGQYRYRERDLNKDIKNLSETTFEKQETIVEDMKDGAENQEALDQRTADSTTKITGDEEQDPVGWMADEIDAGVDVTEMESENHDAINPTMFYEAPITGDERDDPETGDSLILDADVEINSRIDADETGGISIEEEIPVQIQDTDLERKIPDIQEVELKEDEDISDDIQGPDEVEPQLLESVDLDSQTIDNQEGVVESSNTMSDKLDSSEEFGKSDNTQLERHSVDEDNKSIIEEDGEDLLEIQEEFDSLLHGPSTKEESSALDDISGIESKMIEEKLPTLKEYEESTPIIQDDDADMDILDANVGENPQELIKLEKETEHEMENLEQKESPTDDDVSDAESRKSEKEELVTSTDLEESSFEQQDENLNKNDEYALNLNVPGEHDQESLTSNMQEEEEVQEDDDSDSSEIMDIDWNNQDEEDDDEEFLSGYNLEEVTVEKYHVEETQVEKSGESSWKLDEGYVEVSKGVSKKILKEGTGPVVATGDIMTLHCVGYLDGNPPKKFWSTKDPAQHSFTFAVGKREVIKGWDEGAASMKANEYSRIVIEPRKAYGRFGFKAWGIPPNSRLILEIEVIDIKRMRKR